MRKPVSYTHLDVYKRQILYSISQVLGITVIHSLWQGMLVYFVLRIIYAGYPLLPALRKYQLAIFAMASVAILFIYTLFTEIGKLNQAGLSAGHLSALLLSLIHI